MVSALTMLPFLTVVQHASGTRKKTILVSDRIKKKISGQCKSSAQIEPVKNKYTIYVHCRKI